MEVFQGRPVRPGIAIAAAARLRLEFGVPVLDTQRLRQLGERLRGFGMESAEPEQAILIAGTLPTGYLAAPLPGLEFVGVATQSAISDISLIPCPAVDGLPDTLLSAIEEGEIVIVDGDRGRVYIAPDAMVITRYQTPTRMSRRFFLGSGHLPARTTSDDRAVAVLAPSPTLDAVTEAMDAGADGLWVPPDNDFLGPEQSFQTSSQQREALTALMSLAAGKPVYVQVPTERLALSMLSRAAAMGTFSLILEDLSLRAELADRFQEIEGVLESEDTVFGPIRFEAGLTTQEDTLLPETLDLYTGLWLTEPFSTAHMERLLPIAGLAHRAQRPLTLSLLGDDWQTRLSEALDLSADRIIVPATSIADVKDAIRTS
jgi:hypothetical protein